MQKGNDLSYRQRCHRLHERQRCRCKSTFLFCFFLEAAIDFEGPNPYFEILEILSWSWQPKDHSRQVRHLLRCFDARRLPDVRLGREDAEVRGCAGGSLSQVPKTKTEMHTDETIRKNNNNFALNQIN